MESKSNKNFITVLHKSNPAALTFVRQFWTWNWNGGEQVLWKKFEEINDQSISETLMIKESEFLCLQYSSLYYCSQKQLYNIQNSTTHTIVFSSLDFLSMYADLFINFTL